MVDVPFVSEDFQRAFRNQFPAQQSSGRDLHVSDVVIPVVDFTPTASGASLSTDLRFSFNVNTTYLQRTASGNSAFVSSPGFYGCKFNMACKGSDTNAQFGLVETSSSAFNTIFKLTPNVVSTEHTNIQYECTVFIPVGYTLNISMAVGASDSAVLDSSATLLADVNGNLVNPFGYSPQ